MFNIQGPQLHEILDLCITSLTSILYVVITYSLLKAGVDYIITFRLRKIVAI